MIIFVGSKYYKHCMESNFVNKDNHWNISPNPRENMVDASYFVPPIEVINEYLNIGDIEKYVLSYKRYLSQPNMTRLIILSILMSDELPGIYFHYDDISKNLLYPKILRDFMINNLNIPKSIIVKYKEFNNILRLPKRIYEELSYKISLLENKCDEMFDILK